MLDKQYYQEALECSGYKTRQKVGTEASEFVGLE